MKRIVEWLFFLAVAVPLGSVIYEQAVSAQASGRVQGIPRPCRPLDTQYQVVPNARPTFKIIFDAPVLWAEVMNADATDTVGIKMTLGAAEGYPLPPGQSTILYEERPLTSFYIDTEDATAGYAGPALIGVKECE